MCFYPRPQRTPPDSAARGARMSRADRSALGAVVNELPKPRQSRSQETQESLIEAGWEIVRQQPWETISVPDIARRAKRSVGAFYQRFGSKEDFLSVLLHRWLTTGYAEDELDGDWKDEDALIDAFLTLGFARIHANRFLWRAALQRAVDDPAWWEPFRELAAYRRGKLIGRLSAIRGAPLSPEDERRIALGLQVFNSVINNALLNNPGPLKVEDPEFLPVLCATFRTVSTLG